MDMQEITPGRLIINSNHRLDFDDDDPAMNARLRVLPFPRTFDRNDEVRRRLLGEAPQIFNHLIDVARTTGGHLHMSSAVEEATDEMLDAIAPSRRLARAALDCSRDYRTALLRADTICQHLRAVAQEQFSTDNAVAGLLMGDDRSLISHVLKAVSGQYWRSRVRRGGADDIIYTGIKLRPLLSEWIDN
jgi:hypothetical protein